MTTEQISALGAEYRKDAQKLEAKLLLFAFIILISHILEIKPSEVDAAGIKINISDISILRGGLAFIYLYYFWTQVSWIYQGSALMPFELNTRVARHLIRVARKPYRDEKTRKMTWRNPKQVKRHVWWTMFSFNLFYMPFAILAALLIMLSVFIALNDAWDFARYLVNKSEIFFE